jgi:hypothetical protein
MRRRTGSQGKCKNRAKISEAPGPNQLLRPADVMSIPDYRRDRVLSALMMFRHDVGRNLMFTTDTIASEVRGIPIDFVNAGVGYMSEPPAALSG